MAAAISTHYGVSVLLNGRLSSESVRGRLVATNLQSALDCLSFFVGVHPRSDPSGLVYFFGGGETKLLAAMPSYGLTGNALGMMLEGSSVVVGDRLLVNSDPLRVSQLREALEPLATRKSIVVELLLVDVASNTVEYVNAWLQKFQIGAGYGLAAGTMGGAALGQVVKGAQGLVDVQALFQLLEGDKTYKMELRQQSMILSGSKTLFKSGQVQEDITYTTLPNQQSGTAQMVSQITRRTVGLTVDLQATCISETSGAWLFNFSVIDGVIDSTGTEYDTTFTGERIFRPSDGITLLAAFDRKQFQSKSAFVPVLSELKWVGRKLFRTGQANKIGRNVLLFARPIQIP